MPTQHLSLTALTILLTVGGALSYGAFVLYGTWSARSARSDGRREDIRKKGLHPTTDDAGHVHAREERDDS